MNLVKTKKSNVIAYTVKKILNNNIYITIQNGEVVVNAPWYTTQSDIQNIIEERKEWILNKIKEYKKELQQVNSIKRIKVLGLYYNVETIYKNIEAPILDLENETVKITIPSKLKGQDKDIIKLVIQKMYNMIAEKEVERAMEKTRKILGFAPEIIKYQMQ